MCRRRQWSSWPGATLQRMASGRASRSYRFSPVFAGKPASYRTVVVEHGVPAAIAANSRFSRKAGSAAKTQPKPTRGANVHPSVTRWMARNGSVSRSPFGRTGTPSTPSPEA